MRDDAGSTDTREADEPSDAEPGEPEPESATATARTSSGKGKWIAAGLAAILLSGVAGGGYLYRTYGEQFFGSASTDQGLAALESQVMDASGAAQAAREAAESTAGKLDGLNQRMDVWRRPFRTLPPLPARPPIRHFQIQCQRRRKLQMRPSPVHRTAFRQARAGLEKQPSQA
jgi:hypothetical protein